MMLIPEVTKQHEVFVLNSHYYYWSNFTGSSHVIFYCRYIYYVKASQNLFEVFNEALPKLHYSLV